MSTVGSVGARSADVTFAIIGPDLQTLAEYASQLTTQMKASKDMVDIDSSLVFGKPELRVNIKRQRAADLGVNAQEIAQAVNVFVGGQRISTFTVGTNQYDVTLRAQQPFRTTVEGIEQMPVGSTKSGAVPLRDVVDIQQTHRPGQHRSPQPPAAGDAVRQCRAGGSQRRRSRRCSSSSTMHLPASYSPVLSGTSRELGRTGYYFLLAISLSFIFMYMVLAAQFESFIHPVTILLTLPLAMPFGMLSLLITGQTVNIFSGLGLLLLFGIVKKNAILQIDHTNTLRAQGLGALRRDHPGQPRSPAADPDDDHRAGRRHAAAGHLAAAPGAATNRSIGVLVIGGQSLCLLLTLLAVPVFYSLFDDMRGFGARLVGRARPGRDVPGDVVPAGLSASSAAKAR